jgi:hypothetical protein
VPAIIGLLWFGTLYVRGRVYRIPVPSRVLSGDVVRPTHVYLTWNESADAKVSLQVQVATDPKFRNIVFEVEQENISRVQVPGKLVTSGETYYWHVRSQKDGKYSPWTRLIHFKVQD